MKQKNAVFADFGFLGVVFTLQHCFFEKSGENEFMLSQKVDHLYIFYFTSLPSCFGCLVHAEQFFNWAKFSDFAENFQCPLLLNTFTFYSSNPILCISQTRALICMWVSMEKTVYRYPFFMSECFRCQFCDLLKEATGFGTPQRQTVKLEMVAAVWVNLYRSDFNRSVSLCSLQLVFTTLWFLFTFIVLTKLRIQKLAVFRNFTLFNLVLR